MSPKLALPTNAANHLYQKLYLYIVDLCFTALGFGGYCDSAPCTIKDRLQLAHVQLQVCWDVPLLFGCDCHVAMAQCPPVP